MEIYLDNGATTKPCNSAIEACIKAMTVEYGNPSSLHRRGFAAETMIEMAKTSVASLIGATANEIVFTSGATESNNLAIIGSAMANKRRGNKIVSTAIEHPSVLVALDYLETQGFEVTKVFPNQDGFFTVQDFLDVVDDKTILASFMMVNNETGLVLPVEEIGLAIKRISPKIVIHCDAVQGFMKLPMKMKNSSIDLLSFSGHKVYSPKGVGGLYVKRGTRLISQTYGGAQQQGMRAGTEAVPLIMALAGSIGENSGKMNEVMEHYKMLNQYLRNKLANKQNITINSDEKYCAPHIVNLSVNGIRSEIMLHYLEEYEIYVSSGSACSKGKKNYVLSAFSFDNSVSDTAIRVSFCGETTKEMIDIFVDKLIFGSATLAKVKS